MIDAGEAGELKDVLVTEKQNVTRMTDWFRAETLRRRGSRRKNAFLGSPASLRENYAGQLQKS